MRCGNLPHGATICRGLKPSRSFLHLSFRVWFLPATSLDLAKQGHQKLPALQTFTPKTTCSMQIKKTLLVGVIAVVLTPAALVRAQNTNGNIAAPENNSANGNVPAPNQPYQLPDIQVTGEDKTEYTVPDATAATKVDTPIMQTPVSVQVIPQQVLQDQAVTHLDDALQNVSGVIPNNDSFGTADSFTIRGFDQEEMTYEDGLRLDQYSTSGFPRDLANIERIEVVKGPASVLYGQAEPGGLVNIVTKMPLETPYYSLEQQIGSFDTYRTTLDATGPLNTEKTFLYRLNIDYENSDSFRDFITTKRLSLFPTLQWKPDDQNQVTVELKYGTGHEVLDTIGIPFINGIPANIPFSRNLDGPNVNYSPDDEYAVKISASHEFNDNWKLRLVYKSEYHDEPTPFAQYAAGDPDASGNLPMFGFTEKFFEQWTHQAVTDLTGKFETFGIKHTAIAGFDFYYQQGRYDANFYTPASINIYNPIFGQPVITPVDPTADEIVHDGQTAYGAYLQDQVELPGHVFLLGGFRYDQVNTYDDGYTGGAGTVNDKPKPTPRFGILWQPIPQLSLYGSYTSNYGATALGALTQSGAPLHPQSAQQYEVGVKTELFDKRLSITTSVYNLTKENIPATDPNNPLYSIAIGQARSRGVELDISGQIATGWKVIGGYSYIQCLTTEDTTTPSMAGLRFPGVPYNSGSLWTTYEFQNGGWKGLKLGAGVVVRGNEVAYENPTGTDYLADQIPGYATVNLMASYEWMIGSKKVTAQLNIDNVLNKRYFSSLAPGSAYPGAPISATFSLRADF